MTISDNSISSGKWEWVQELPDKSSDEYEDEEEVFYVTLDVGKNVNPSDAKELEDIQVAGLDTREPLLRVGNSTLKGTPETLVGSELLLTSDAEGSYKPLGVSEERISFEKL